MGREQAESDPCSVASNENLGGDLVIAALLLRVKAALVSLIDVGQDGLLAQCRFLLMHSAFKIFSLKTQCTQF